MCAGLIDKDKNITIQHRSAQLITDNTAQAVKAFAHIFFFTVQVVPPGIAKRYNAAHCNSSNTQT